MSHGAVTVPFDAYAQASVDRVRYLRRRVVDAVDAVDRAVEMGDSFLIGAAEDALRAACVVLAAANAAAPPLPAAPVDDWFALAESLR